MCLELSAWFCARKNGVNSSPYDSMLISRLAVKSPLMPMSIQGLEYFYKLTIFIFFQAKQEIQ